MTASLEIAHLLTDAANTDTGLICAFEFSDDDHVREIESVDVPNALSDPSSRLWLHYNLSNVRARNFLSQAAFIPEELREAIEQQDARRRIEWVDAGLLVVISDLTFEQESDPDEVGPLWCFVTDRLLVTARTHPLKTTDELRAAMRRGFKVATCYQLLVWLFGHRTHTVRELGTNMSERVSEIEDEILAGNIKQQREELGRIRRLCARLRRHLLPDRSGLHKLLQRRNGAWSEEDAELMRTESEELSFLIDDLSELYERAKLLQEELASRVAEDTGRSLYLLAILSAVFLPMTLVTGIFGMNVAGLPGVHDDAAFLWVMLVILIAGLAVAAPFLRKRF